MKILAITLTTTVRRFNTQTGKTRGKLSYEVTLYFDAPPSAADVLAVLEDETLTGQDRAALKVAAPFLRERPDLVVPCMDRVVASTMPFQKFRNVLGTRDQEEVIFTQQACWSPLRIITVKEH